MSTIADIAPLVSLVESEKRDADITASELVKDEIICEPEALAAENENTPEVTKISVEQSISPASAAVMQSIFYKEMMVKPGEEENSSSTDSCESIHDENCSCQDLDSSDGSVEMGVEINLTPPANKEESFKSFDLADLVAEDESVSKDTTDVEDEFSDARDSDNDDMPKEDVILNILSQLDPLAVDQVQEKSAGVIEEQQVEAEELEEVQEEPEESQEEVEEAQVSPEEALEAADNLLDLSVKEVVNAAVDFVIAQEIEQQQSVVVLDHADKAVVIQLPTTVSVEEEVQEVVVTPVHIPLTPAELQARAMYVIPNLEPLFGNDKWFTKQCITDVRQALANVGICATQLLMDTLNTNPNLYHFRKEECWFGKNLMVMKGLNATLARIGIIDPSSESFRMVFNNLQRFSGTYLFIRHAVDHGNFTDDKLENLRLKGEFLRKNGNQNTELKRCMAISNNKLKDSDVPMCGEPVQMVPWLMVQEGTFYRQNNPMPLSPRVLNQQQSKQLSPRKRASGSKENGGGAPPAKRFVFDDDAMQLARFGLHRM